MSIYSDIVVADGANSYWRLGETGGTNANDEIATDDGTYTGGFTLAQASGIYDPDPSVAFNGTTGYVTIPDAAKFSLFTTNLLTVEAWANLDTVSGTADQIVCAKGIVTAYEWSLSTNKTVWRAQIFDAGGGDNQRADVQGPAVATGKWYHLVMTMDEGTDTLILYVNGSEVGRDTSWGATSNVTTSAVDIGRRPDASGFLDGFVDEVAIYPSVLTNLQVLNHYRVGAGANRGVSQTMYSAAGVRP